MDSLKCQTVTATPAEPGDLPCWFSEAGGAGRPGGLVAIAAADRNDLPTFRLERGNIHLGTEADTDDADMALG